MKKFLYQIERHVAELAGKHGLESSKYKLAREAADAAITENRRLAKLWLDAVDRKTSASMKFDFDEREYEQASQLEAEAYSALELYQTETANKFPLEAP